MIYRKNVNAYVISGCSQKVSDAIQKFSMKSGKIIRLLFCFNRNMAKEKLQRLLAGVRKTFWEYGKRSEGMAATAAGGSAASSSTAAGTAAALR